MSADLFAEFGANSNSKQQTQKSLPAPARPGIQQTSSFAFFDGWSSTAAATPASKQPSQSPSASLRGFNPSLAPQAVEDDNDDWGDFEGGSVLESAPHAHVDPHAVVQSHTALPAQTPWNTAPAAISVSTFDRKDQPNPPSWQKASIVKAKISADPTVLFDAGDDHDDDEFGEFEGTEDAKVAKHITTATSSALVDLLGDMSVSQPTASGADPSQNAHAQQHSKSMFTAKQSYPSMSSSVARPPEPFVAAAPREEEDDAGWDSFNAWEQTIPGTSSAKEASELKTTIKARITPQIFTSTPILSPTYGEPQPGELPPTNVPPPGSLLSLFPSLFNDAQEKLFRPMAAQTLPMRNKLMAEPAAIAYIAGYLVLANVAAHIISGRKLRWKRDQHLSQGMRIGPASSRATSGMKLTGIDKSENMKEEREVSDVVRAWKEQVGRLRHVVSGANQIKAGILGPVPDLQEVMPVRTLKQSEGGMPARQPCMLCGLKREERVTAADLATDDSFGEWWVDQVNMHRSCRNFWNEHKDMLRQR